MSTETNVLLNHNMRVEIERSAMKPFDERLKKLAEREYALTERVYNKLVPQPLREALALVEERDTRFLNKTNSFQFNVGGQSYLMRVGPAPAYPTLPSGNTHTGRGWVPGSLDYTKDEHKKLIDAVRGWQNDYETYKAERATAERTLRALLKSVRSTKSLFSVWPEGRKHYSVPPLVPAVRSGVPAVQIVALNEMLGLVKKKAA